MQTVYIGVLVWSASNHSRALGALYVRQNRCYKSLTVTILRLRAHPVLAEDRLFAMVVRDSPWG